MPGSRLAAWLVAVAIVAMQAPAMADGRALLLAPSGDASNSDRNLARTTIEQGLVASGYTIVRAEEVTAMENAAALRSCENSACARAAFAPLGLGMAVSVAAWRPGRFRETGKVSVILSDADGREVSEDATLDRRTTVAQAAAEALAGALAKWPPMGPVPVEVASDPVAATATLDRAPLGETPVRAEVPPGQHTLTLARDGYRTLRAQIEVTNHAERVQRFSFKLERGEDVITAPAATMSPVQSVESVSQSGDKQTRTTAWKWIAGGGMIAVGAALTVAGVVGFASAGDQNDGGRTRNSASTTSVAAVAGGAPLLLGGVALLVF
ncbi:MAG: PEGA domain-containing protein [Polyangiales bacterium]